MHDVLVGIGVAAFIVYAIFNIAYIMSMKRMSERIERFLGGTGENLNTTLAELKATLENTRKVTADVREIADTVVSLERGVRELYQQVLESAASSTEANLAGLKAGIKTGVAALVRNMQQERSDDHERGTEQ